MRAPKWTERCEAVKEDLKRCENRWARESWRGIRLCGVHQRTDHSMLLNRYVRYILADFRDNRRLTCEEHGNDNPHCCLYSMVHEVDS